MKLIIIVASVISGFVVGLGGFIAQTNHFLFKATTRMADVFTPRKEDIILYLNGRHSTTK